MPINLERWKNQEDLTSQNFNRRLIELETHFNSLVEKNTKLEEENTELKKLLDNKVDINIHLNNNTDFNTLTEIGAYSISVGGINAPVFYNDALPTHWSITVRWGNPNSNVFYQIAQTVREPNKIFKRQCINGGFGSWVTFTGTP